MTASPAGGRDFWDRSIIGWHAVWVGVLVVTALVLALGGFTAAERTTGLGAVAVLLLAYLLVGARIVARDAPQPAGRGELPAALYLAVVTGGLLVVQSVAGLDLLAPALFALFPQLWVLLTRAGAITATVVVPVVLGAGRAAQLGWAPTAVRDATLETAAQAGVSLLLGLWITGLVRESTGRAELVAQLTAAREQLAAAEHARGVLAERERVAREIHDTLAQGFTSVIALAQAADAALEGAEGAAPDGVELARQRLALMEATARANLAEARAIVEALRPADLQQPGSGDGQRLAGALRRAVERFTAETGVRASVRGAEALPALPPETEVVLLRAAQEGLSNVRRHAGARSAHLDLDVGAGEVVLRVTDDGRGPRVLPAGDQGPAAPGAGGYGLSAMASRLREVGGRVALSRGEGGGSELRVRVPLARHQSGGAR